MHLAEFLHRHGTRVAVLDCDEQQLSQNHLEAAAPDIEVRVAQDAKQIGSELRELSRTFTVIVADAPKGTDKASQALLRKADLVIVPLMPSMLDLKTTVDETEPLIDQVRKLRRARGLAPFKAMSVINGVDRRSSVGKQIAKLAPTLKRVRLPPAKTTIRRSVSWQNATVTKQFIHQMKASGPKCDLLALFREVLNRKVVSLDPKRSKRGTTIRTSTSKRVANA